MGEKGKQGVQGEVEGAPPKSLLKPAHERLLLTGGFRSGIFISGGMADWTKAAVLKTAVGNSHRGFESHSLRLNVSRPGEKPGLFFSLKRRQLGGPSLGKASCFPLKTCQRAGPQSPAEPQRKGMGEIAFPGAHPPGSLAWGFRPHAPPIFPHPRLLGVRPRSGPPSWPGCRRGLLAPCFTPLGKVRKGRGDTPRAPRHGGFAPLHPPDFRGHSPGPREGAKPPPPRGRKTGGAGGQVPLTRGSGGCSPTKTKLGAR